MKPKYYDGILTQKRQLGPFPMEKLRRVEQPTTKIIGNIQRFDEREHGFARARRGDFGPLKGSLASGKDLIGLATSSAFFTFPPVDVGVASVMPPMPKGPMDSRTPMPTVITGVASQRAPIPEDPAVLSRHIKSLGYFLRADIVGICQLPQWAVYSHDMAGNPVECNHKNAICIMIDQGYRTMKASRGDDWISFSQSQQSYSTSAFIANIMADYIRRLGYPARVHHARNYQVVVPPLLLLSGIGEMSRAGIVLNPFLGMRFKASVVTTDLPLMPDKPVDFGLQEFCQKCLKCATDCPSGAITTGDKVIYNGYEVWKLDVARCTKYRVGNQKGSFCGSCIKVCPWNKPKGWTHDVVRWLVQHAPFLDSFIVKMDDVWGYGKQNKRDKWWFE